MAEEETWTRDDFHRRHYTVEGDDLDRAKKIELIVRVDGKVMVQVEAREPGIVAFVSKPAEQGFHIELVERGKVRYTDVRTIEGRTTEPLLPWQQMALGFEAK